MSNRLDRLMGFVTIRSSGTALTATGQGADLTSARIANFKSGVAFLDVWGATALTTATIAVEGRDTSTGAYSALASFTVTATGQYIAAIDRMKNRLRYNLSVLTGTNISFSLHVIGELAQFVPAGDVINS